MPIYKGLNYVLLVFYTEEIENCCVEIKNRREISEQSICNTLLRSEISSGMSLDKEGTHFSGLTSLLVPTRTPFYLPGAELVKGKVSKCYKVPETSINQAGSQKISTYI